jgi:hypothetical protein
MITQSINVNLLDKSDVELAQIARFHARFPSTATDTRAHLVSLILEARKMRRAADYRSVKCAVRYEAEVFAILFGVTDEVTDEVRDTYNGSEYSQAA